MKIQEKYAKASDSEADKENKTVLSDDAFAICEFIEGLTDKLERARRALLR